MSAKQRLTVKEQLAEELEARVSAMAATGDVPESEREQVALDDIVNLDAEAHGAHTPEEVAAWNAVRKAAKRHLHRNLFLDCGEHAAVIIPAGLAPAAGDERLPLIDGDLSSETPTKEGK